MHVKFRVYAKSPQIRTINYVETSDDLAFTQSFTRGDSGTSVFRCLVFAAYQANEHFSARAERRRGGSRPPPHPTPFPFNMNGKRTPSTRILWEFFIISRGEYYSLVSLLFLEDPSERWESLRPEDSFGKLTMC